LPSTVTPENEGAGVGLASACAEKVKESAKNRSAAARATNGETILFITFLFVLRILTESMFMNNK
jgi:hypothetical protein